MLSQRLCRDRVVCPGSDSPYANLSSEANDPALYLGVRYCWDNFSHYPRLCWSEVNLPDALQCAEGLCRRPTPGFPFRSGFGYPGFSQVDPPEPSGSGGGFPPDAPPDLIPPPVQDPPGSDNYVFPTTETIVWNERQECTICIPDGPCFTYVCEAGTFYAIVTPP